MNPDSDAVYRLRTATLNFLRARPQERPETRERLHLAHSDLSRQLATQGRFCAAAEQQAAAVAISPDPEESARLHDYERRCATDLEAAEVSTDEALEGHLLYSTVDEGRYRIFRIPAEFNPLARLLAENATQPALSPAGSMLAVYSTRSDLEGLAGIDLAADLAPNERSIRFTPSYVEDARESPASWSPQGDRLVFASTREGDKRSRIYITWANGKDDSQSIAFGKDPAWHPQQELIVFNGRDLTGNNPGLWLIDSSGGGLRRITNAEDDLRPVWTPDGRHILFMNRSRSGNWDIYRYDLEEDELTAVTDSVSRDLLPAISPDGEHIAFVSDRDGIPRIWVLPWLQGEPEPLAMILGSQTDWLEHSIQWIE